MANTIDTIGNGNGYLYITDTAGTLINSIRNDADGVKRSRSVAVVGAPIATNRSSAGEIVVADCNSVGNITSITVNGVEQLGAPIPVTTSDTSELAVLIAQAINSSIPGSGYKYTAYTQTITAILLAPINAGATPNGYNIVVSVDDPSIDIVATDFDGGITNTGSYDQQFGVRVWLNNDTLSSPTSIAGAEDITEFLTTRGMNSGIPQLDYTANDDALSTVDRTAAIQVINVTPQTTADDVLCFIDPRNFMTGDHVVIRNTSDVYALTLQSRDYSDSLFPFKNIVLNDRTSLTLSRPGDFVELVYRYDPMIGGMFDVYDYQVISPNMITLTWSELNSLISNGKVLEGVKYRITDATTYDISLIVNGLNSTTVSNFAYSEDFPQDEIWYDFAGDVITRRTDSLKNLSAPFDWRNQKHTLYRRKFDVEALGYPCSPVSYDYIGSPVPVGNPDAETAGLVFNNSNDVLVWLQSILGGLACMEDTVGYILTLYGLFPFDSQLDNFTLNDGSDFVATFEDDTKEFYTFGNNIASSSGANTDLLIPAVDGNGGTCYNIWVNDYPGGAVPTVIGDYVHDIKCGRAIITDNAYNVTITNELDSTYLFSNNQTANIGSLVGSIYSNVDYGGCVASSIDANLFIGLKLVGFDSYTYNNAINTKRYATERSDSSLGLYDYRTGIDLQIEALFIIAFSQSVDRITENADLLGSASIRRAILQPDSGCILTLTNTAVASLSAEGQIVSEDGVITLDGSNGDYAIIESAVIGAYGVWKITEYHNYV